MSIPLTDHRASLRASPQARWFGRSVFLLATLCFALAGFAPVGCSIATVFLFAGPHNWMEARFFLSRMPVRWSRLRSYYVLGIAGVFVLSLGSLLLPAYARSWQWQRGDWFVGIASWNTLFVLWVTSLALQRAKETGSDRWLYSIPIGLVLVAVAWMWPLAWNLALVYLHPLVALWFLDRELGCRRPAWQATYRRSLLAVPAYVIWLVWLLGASPRLPGDDLLTLQIAHHAGAGLITNVSSRCLVAIHTFLEMLHYAAWIVAIPLIGYAGAAWNLQRVPLARRSEYWKMGIVITLGLGAVCVCVLWAGFIADYPLTRDIYFSIAVLHVLAEVPFLLRLP